MTPRKLNVLFCSYPYGGNGGIASEVNEIRHWFHDTVTKAKADERVGRVDAMDEVDTPITMTRNNSVVAARQRGIDILVMVDSDQAPDYLVGLEPDAVPFWDTAFDFLYDHYAQGPVCIGAPYVGSGVENIFVFRWRVTSSNNPDDQFSLNQYTREEATEMAGIHECAALPTGLIMFDMRCFDLIEPKDSLLGAGLAEHLRPQLGERVTQGMIQDIVAWTERHKIATEQSFFYYEYADKYQAQKHSTEDVTCTRDISLAGQLALGYNPVHCAWSSWAGHWKRKLCGKPQLLPVDFVASKLARAAASGRQSNMKQVEVHLEGNDHKQAGDPRRIIWRDRTRGIMERDAFGNEVPPPEPATPDRQADALTYGLDLIDAGFGLPPRSTPPPEPVEAPGD